MKAMEKKKDFDFLEYFDYRLYLLSRMYVKERPKIMSLMTSKDIVKYWHYYNKNFKSIE